MPEGAYSFAIHAKARIGRLKWRPFITAFVDTLINATAFNTWLNGTALANYAKSAMGIGLISVNPADFQIPITHVIQDVKEFKVLMGSSADPDKKRTFILPGLKKDLSDEDIVDFLINAGLTTDATGLVPLDKVITYTPKYVNVVTGPPV